MPQPISPPFEPKDKGENNRQVKSGVISYTRGGTQTGSTYQQPAPGSHRPLQPLPEPETRDENEQIHGGLLQCALGVRPRGGGEREYQRDDRGDAARIAKAQCEEEKN